jgi:hypothetical protein
MKQVTRLHHAHPNAPQLAVQSCEAATKINARANTDQFSTHGDVRTVPHAIRLPRACCWREPTWAFVLLRCSRSEGKARASE